MREKVDAGEPPTELWEALAEKGYLGVNIPEEYDGGGRGMTELAAVGEEIARAGLLAAADRRLAGDRRQRAGAARHARSRRTAGCAASAGTT